MKKHNGCYYCAFFVLLCAASLSGKAEAPLLKWIGQKPKVVDGKIKTWIEAPGFLQWREAQPEKDGFAGRVLTISLTGPFHKGAWCQHAGALLKLKKAVPKNRPFVVTFKARTLSGAPYLQVLRTWGSSRPWRPVKLQPQWKSFRVEKTAVHPTDSITFSLVPKMRRLQPYCAGVFELTDVRVRYSLVEKK